MPGIVGIVSTSSANDARERFDIASTRMLRHRGTRLTQTSGLQGLAVLGQVALDHPRRAAAAPDACNVVFHGVLHNLRDLASEVSLPSTSSPEAVLSAGYSSSGKSFLARLEGEFCYAIVDESRKTVLVATDPIATYSVRWHHDETGLTFASDLSAVIKASPSARRLNLSAVADYLTIGFVLADKTLVEGVSELDPGTMLEFDTQAGTVSRQTYFSAATLFTKGPANRDDYFDRLATEFKAAVGRSIAGDSVGLSLSGGLDSRAILGMAATSGVELRTYTLGVNGCADQVIAQRMSRIAGTKHTFFTLDESYLRDFLPNMAEMVSITDGGYLSHGLTEMLAIRFLPKTGIRLLVRGHGGELAKAHLAWPLHTDPAVRQMTTVEELVPYLSRRANYVTAGLSLASLFSKDAGLPDAVGSSASFAEVLRGVTLTPAECCSYLYLRELHRRFTVPSLELFRTCADVRLPYTDVRYLRVLLAAPAEWRDSTEIHRVLTQRGRPALNRVRNSNTGAPASVGSNLEFFFDKANTLLKRLNVYGFRHYHNFDAWMHRMLLEAVESQLLAASGRVQTFIPRDTLAKLINDTRQGAADRAYLLQVLLILELWQRENGVAA